MDQDSEALEPLTPVPKSSKAKKQASGKSKYTPLELQFLDLKRKHPDVLLAVEVGYKFRFFEQDALTASKELNIVAYMDKNLRGASIPTHRLNVHVSKLVSLGYKVGIVRQTETAALKAVGDNKSGPFARTLTNIFTKSTFIDPDMLCATLDGGAETRLDAERSSYLLVLSETPHASIPEKTTLHIVAVQLSTGELLFDSFADGALRGELETRLEHIRPVEMLLPAESTLSTATESVLKHWAIQREVEGDVVRVERLVGADHYWPRVPEISQPRRVKQVPKPGTFKYLIVSKPLYEEIYEQLHTVPSQILPCLSAVLHHLTEFNLAHVLHLTKSFAPFSAKGHMVLSGPTLRALEILEAEGGAHGVGGRGSLAWVLDHTVTRFGGRLLRRWIGRPLVDVQSLRERIDAVEEVIECIQSDHVPMIKLRGLLHQLPDLEKSLARIHYTRCPPADLFSTLTCLSKIATTLHLPPSAPSPFRSRLLTSPFERTLGCAGVVEQLLARLDAEACAKNIKRCVFVIQEEGMEEEMSGAMRDVKKLRAELKECEDGFGEILNGIRKTLKGTYARCEFVTVSGTEYLIEVKASHLGIVPKDWIKINGLKALSRFHTPKVLEQMERRNILIEKLNAAAEAAYLDEVSEHYQDFRAMVQSLAVADCLVSLAKVASQPGYIKPEYVDESVMEVRGGRHPMVELLISDFVTNNVSLKENDRCLLITGPNMGGKSSYIRQVALIAIMGQIGSYVPAEYARLGIFDAVFTRMGAYDDITRGHSTFMKELTETSEILARASQRSLCILDELGRGTSTHDGTAIAYATLRYLVERVRCATLFVTHYPSLGATAVIGGVRCAHMGFLAEEEVKGVAPVVTFLYKLTEGLANRSYGLNVARLAGLPASILDCALAQSRRLEALHEQRHGGVTENLQKVNELLNKLK
ncbi:muts domain V-domain-containing protein [Chytriomyces sp. MP71]|nr:muts domain V-domain-containing protein [Chytriomyces sp. MP71]